MDNRPEYVAIWLGLSKIGAISALINYNLRKDSLLHCIQVSNSKAVIAVARLKDGNNFFSIPYIYSILLQLKLTGEKNCVFQCVYSETLI